MNPILEGAVIVTSGTMNLEGKDTWVPKKEYYCKNRADWIPFIEGTETYNAMT